MFSAIVSNNIDFAKIFIENGFMINEFLTYRRLIQFYNEIPTNSVLYGLLRRNKRNKRKTYDSADLVFKLKEIGEILRFLLGGNFMHQFLKRPLCNIILDETRRILRETVILYLLTRYSMAQLNQSCANYLFIGIIVIVKR